MLDKSTKSPSCNVTFSRIPNHLSREFDNVGRRAAADETMHVIALIDQ